MNKVMGIVNLHSDVEIEGLTHKRPVGCVSFLGRYALMDFALSNYSNSGIDEVGILIKDKPRSLFKHLSNQNAWNFNSKSGGIKMLYNENTMHPKYNHALNNLKENKWFIEQSNATEIIIAPPHLINTINYNDVVEQHRSLNSDITVVYHKVNDCMNSFIGEKYVFMDGGRVIDFIENKGDYCNRSISLQTYVMNKEVLLNLIDHRLSAMYSMDDLIMSKVHELKIHGYCYEGYVRCIDSLKSYYDCSLELLNLNNFNKLFRKDWTIYTNTNDTPPSKYGSTSSVQKSFVANGALINGVVENSILGRDVVIEEGANVRNCILLSGSTISSNCIVDGVIVDKSAMVLYKQQIESKDYPLFVEEGAIV